MKLTNVKEGDTIFCAFQQFNKPFALSYKVKPVTVVRTTEKSAWLSFNADTRRWPERRLKNKEYLTCAVTELAVWKQMRRHYMHEVRETRDTIALLVKINRKIKALEKKNERYE